MGKKKYAQSIKVIEKLNLLNMKSKIIIVGSIPPSEYEIPDYVKIIPFLNKNNKEKNILHNLYSKSHYFILLVKLRHLES